MVKKKTDKEKLSLCCGNNTFNPKSINGKLSLICTKCKKDVYVKNVYSDSDLTQQEEE